MISPVFGFRPCFTLRKEREKLPKPTSLTSSPSLRVSLMDSSVASKNCSACIFVDCVFFAMSSTSCALFILEPFSSDPFMFSKSKLLGINSGMPKLMTFDTGVKVLP